MSDVIKPIKKTNTCANCGVPKGTEVLCPVCHSVGPLYLFEWLIIGSGFLIILFIVLVVVALVVK
jgi:hypothetical protein